MKGADPLTTDFGRAVDLANRAVAVDPTSDRAYIALMMAKFYAGDPQSAIAAGNTAMELNPDNPDVLAKLAGVLFNAGFREAALSLANEASANVEAVPRDARIVLSLEAYLRGDYSEASLGSEQINYSDFVVQAIRAAALGEMSSSSSAGSLARLREMLPDYRTSLRTWMERRRYSAEVIVALEAGIAKAEQIRAPNESLAQASY
jgi:tetratricopeptide (TPR) repeat protein